MVTVVGRFEREKANLDVFAGVEYPVVVLRSRYCRSVKRV